MIIHQSAEDYLETILMLTERQGKVRSIDVVNELGYTKASVSIAMKKLRENGYIAVDGEGNLTLLPPGQEIAERIYSRHRLLTHFFMQLGVDEKTAAEDACKAEHILSETTLAKIRERGRRAFLCFRFREGLPYLALGPALAISAAMWGYFLAKLSSNILASLLAWAS